ncbi:MAG: lipopolysaccharide biosynthesis protein [Solirubrobacteraceae bacterium]
MTLPARHVLRRRLFFGARPSELTRQVGFNAVAQVMPIAVAFVLTPVLLHGLGQNRFGLWSLALVIVTTLTTLDGGISASLARFFAVHSARDDRAEAGRLLLGALLVLALIGVVLTILVYPLAPRIVPLLHIPLRLHREATLVFRWLPPLATAGLMADAIAAVLQGNLQFRALSATTLASSFLFAVAVLVLVHPGSHVQILLVATALRYSSFGIGSLVAAVRWVSFQRPLLPSRAMTREVWMYSSRMQLSAVTGFVNTQMDALVIAAVLPVRYVGLYSIGMQAASALRSVPLYAFPPLLTLFSKAFAISGRDAAAAQFNRMERRWLPAVLGFGIIALSAIGFGVPIWLGRRYDLSGLTAALLLAGYTAHVGLTGMRTCYVRAVGRPGLETRYSLVWTVTNALATIPCALLAGELGVVAATAGTGVLASVYFVVLCRRREQLPVVLPERRWWFWCAVSVAVTVVGEIMILETGLHGYLAFALAALPGLLGLLIVATGARLLTPAAAQPAS